MTDNKKKKWNVLKKMYVNKIMEQGGKKFKYVLLRENFVNK